MTQLLQKIILFLFGGFLLSVASFAQSSGIIYKESESFMPGAGTSMGVLKYKEFFSGDQSRQEYENTSQQFSIVDFKTRKGYVCMTELGVMVEMGMIDGLTITYPDETKDILGYSCRKGIAEGPGIRMEFYITNEINANSAPAPLLGQVQGVVLEWEQTFPSRSVIRTTAIDLTAKVELALFETPSLRIVSKEELIQLISSKK